MPASAVSLGLTPSRVSLCWRCCHLLPGPAGAAAVALHRSPLRWISQQGEL